MHSPERRRDSTFGRRRLIGGLTLLGLSGLCSVVMAQGYVSIESAGVAADLDNQGHRGCRGLRPENTIAAFTDALALAVTTLEFGVRATRDGVLVLHHDAYLDPMRCVNDDGSEVSRTPIKELRYEHLQAIDCGRVPDPHFPRQLPDPGARIPRLEQVLALARDASYPVRLNVEILSDKGGCPVRHCAETLVSMLDEHGLIGRAMVQSFDPQALLAVKAVDSRITRSIRVKSRKRFHRLVRESDSSVLSPDYRELRPEDIAHFHNRNIAVIPWTVNQPDDMRRLMIWGVDGMISDYPDDVIRVYKQVRSTEGHVGLR